MDPAINTTLQTANGWLTLPSSLKRADGKPRFNLNFPLYFVSDPGATHLIAHETNGGYEPPNPEPHRTRVAPGRLICGRWRALGFLRFSGRYSSRG
jgi:hypothetical protein